MEARVAVAGVSGHAGGELLPSIPDAAAAGPGAPAAAAVRAVTAHRGQEA